MFNIFKKSNRHVKSIMGAYGFASDSDVGDMLNFFPIRNYFISKYSVFPNEMIFSEIKKEHLDEIVRKYEGLIISKFTDVKNASSCTKFFIHVPELKSYVYVQYYGCNEYGKILIAYLDISLITALINGLKNNEFISSSDQTKLLNILSVTSTGAFKLNRYEISDYNLDLNLHYNSDFIQISDIIKEGLSKDKSKGLVLLHGDPGTGKTTYLRHLICSINKKMIYIPPNLVNHISNPEFISFIMDQQNAILIIEDAENILMQRDGNSSPAIANILNFTDGLLSDCAHIQIVATFNCNVSKIDTALLRKGRLLARYEFGKLKEDKVKKLSEVLNVELSGDQCVGDIYGASGKSFAQQKAKIGFSSAYYH